MSITITIKCYKDPQEDPKMRVVYLGEKLDFRINLYHHF